MSETKFERVRFCDLVREIRTDEIVLPDFQRGFVWREREKQKSLLASVLTKLPIGTILLLQIEKGTYGCKKIGLKNKRPDIPEMVREIRALLDGQQRVTVLTAFFSNELYQMDSGAELVAPSLKRRYFLKLPKLQELFEKRDLFGGATLTIPKEMEQRSYPDYSTDEICSWITSFESQKYKEVLYGDISNVNMDALLEFCTNNPEENQYYFIPLYYLYGAATKNDIQQRNRLRKVIERIAEMYQNEITDVLKLDDIHRQVMTEQCFLASEDGKRLGERLLRDAEEKQFAIKREDSELFCEVSALLTERAGKWAEDLREFLESCIDELELYKIEVEQSNILRAIDIYQNLNLGGKSLDVFDLILARAATQDENENLLQVVQNYVLSDHKEDYEVFKQHCCGKIRNAYELFAASRDEYSASMQLGGWDSKEDELSSAFCKALMSTVGTLNYFLDGEGQLAFSDAGKIAAFKAKVTKSEYLLRIEPEKLDLLVRSAGTGMDRACFFLQMRCGIRNINEIQYKLVFVILSVIFSEKKWFENARVCNYLETWYWSAIFSGSFKLEQNMAFQENMKKILLILKDIEEGANPRKDYLIQLCNNVFCDDKFANEDILLVNNQYVEPEEVLPKTICQFYLSKTYSDILRPGTDTKYEQKEISVFSEFDGKLQRHHIMPVGEMGTLFKDVENQLVGTEKENQLGAYRSPLNLALISPKANRLISNHPLSYYIQYCDNGALQKLGITYVLGEHFLNKNTDMIQFLHGRYRKLCADLKDLFASNLGIAESDLEDFYEKSKSKQL